MRTEGSMAAPQEPGPEEKPPPKSVERKLETVAELKAWVIEAGYASGPKDPLILKIDQVYEARQAAWQESKFKAIKAIQEGAQHLRDDERNRSERMERYYAGLIEKVSRTDEKTGLLNFGWFRLELIKYLLQKTGEPVKFAVGLADIAGFKTRINDVLGHLVGDRVIVAVAEILKHRMRSDDLIARERRAEPRGDTVDWGHSARFGGDEFCFFLPDTAFDDACTVSERFRRAVEEYQWGMIHLDLGLNPVGISIGVCCITGVVGKNVVDQLAVQILSCADDLMYQSKKGGSKAVFLKHFEIGEGTLRDSK